MSKLDENTIAWLKKSAGLDIINEYNTMHGPEEIAEELRNTITLPVMQLNNKLRSNFADNDRVKLFARSGEGDRKLSSAIDATIENLQDMVAVLENLKEK